MRGTKVSICLIVFYCMFFSSCNSKKANEKKVYSGNLFNDNFLHEIRLNFKDANFWDSLVLYKKLKDSTEMNRYLKCNITIDGTELNDIGIRFKGESSYDFTKGKKKSFKLDLNYYVRKQKYGGVSRINLNNNYKDPSLMREKLTLDILAKEGLPASRNAYAKVFLNDTYWGVYLMVEAINKDFLTRSFTNSNGNLYFGEPNGTLEKFDNPETYYRNYRKKTNKKRNDWSDLIRFISVVNADENENKEAANLDSIFHVDNCLKTWAINNMLVNIDAYNTMYPHNYFLYFDSTSKKMHWINYDYNYSFGAWNPKYNYSDICNFPIFYCNEKLPLANLILAKNKILKKRYLDILTKLVETHLSDATMKRGVKLQYDLIKEAVLEDTFKEYSNEEFEKNCNFTLGDKKDPGAYIPGLLEFVADRRSSILKQLNENKSIN